MPRSFTCCLRSPWPLSLCCCGCERAFVVLQSFMSLLLPHAFCRTQPSKPMHPARLPCLSPVAVRGLNATKGRPAGSEERSKEEGRHPHEANRDDTALASHANVVVEIYPRVARVRWLPTCVLDSSDAASRQSSCAHAQSLYQLPRSRTYRDFPIVVIHAA